MNTFLSSFLGLTVSRKPLGEEVVPGLGWSSLHIESHTDLQLSNVVLQNQQSWPSNQVAHQEHKRLTSFTLRERQRKLRRHSSWSTLGMFWFSNFTLKKYLPVIKEILFASTGSQWQEITAARFPSRSRWEDLRRIFAPGQLKHFIGLLQPSESPLAGVLIFGSLQFIFYCHARFFHPTQLVWSSSLNTGQSASQTRRCHWWLCPAIESFWELPPIHLLSKLYGHNCHKGPAPILPPAPPSALSSGFCNIPVGLYFFSI